MGNIVICGPYLSDETMRFDDVWLILKLDVKKWSRLHLPVNFAHTNAKYRGYHKGQERKRGCCCTPGVLLLLYHYCRYSVYQVPWLRGCFALFPRKCGFTSPCPSNYTALGNDVFVPGISPDDRIIAHTHPNIAKEA